LMDDPSLVNANSYGSWMICLELNDLSEIEELLKAEEYEELCNKEE